MEDDPAVRLSLRLAGQKEGFEVAEAGSGPEALAELARQRPDLVLLDLMLPGPSGFDVCRSVHQRDPSLPVIILTARGDEVDKVVGLELGAAQGNAVEDEQSDGTPDLVPIERKSHRAAPHRPAQEPCRGHSRIEGVQFPRPPLGRELGVRFLARGTAGEAGREGQCNPSTK